MVVAVAAMVAGLVAAARVEVAVVVVVVATMAVVLVSLLTLYRPSTTILIHFVLKLMKLLKLIFPENKKIHNLETIGLRAF